MTDSRYTHSSIKDSPMHSICKTETMLELVPEEPGMCVARIVRLDPRPLPDAKVVEITGDHDLVNLCWNGYEHIAGIGETHEGRPTLRVLTHGVHSLTYVHACPIVSRSDKFNGWYGIGEHLVGCDGSWPFGFCSLPFYDRMIETKHRPTHGEQ